MDKVFISYSRKDIEFARKLAGDLEKAGYDVWWDITDLRGGDDWVSTIPAAIAASKYMIVVLTPNSIESTWVRKEYTQALSLRKKIVPIMLVPCSVPFALNTINFVNFSEGEYENNFKNLLSPLGFTGKPPEVTPYNQTAVLLASMFRKYWIYITIGLILLLIFAWPSISKPTVTSTPTLAPTFTATELPITATSTISPTVTSSTTHTSTSTATSTRTPSATPLYEIRIQICIAAESPNIYVRSGPGKQYDSIVMNVRDEDGNIVCPWFSARNENEGYFWLQISPDQRDVELQEFESKWIRQDLLDRTVSIEIIPVVTLTASPTPSNTPTVTPSFTPSSTPTITPSSTATATFTSTPTNTPTPTHTATQAPTDTPSP